jgi:hypothetical protein
METPNHQKELPKRHLKRLLYHAGGLTQGGGKRKKGRKRKEKGIRERKKRRRYESITIHCNEEEVERKRRLITELEQSIA